MSKRTNLEWCEALTPPPIEAAIVDLRDTLLRGLRYGLAERGVTAADLEDFVQDALLKILRELASFRGEARFTTWAQKVAVRVALSELRRRRWRDVSLQDLLVSQAESGASFTALTDTAAGPEKKAVQGIMIDKIQRLIAEELTDRQRQAMTAVMQGGMPLEEVAVRMGTNRNALYKLLHDARKRLQKRMMGEGLSPDEILAMFDEV